MNWQRCRRREVFERLESRLGRTLSPAERRDCLLSSDGRVVSLRGLAASSLTPEELLRLLCPDSSRGES